MKSHMLDGRIFTITALTAVLMVAGCASKPIVAQNRTLVVIPEFYTVQAGDSLSSIAFRYGLNYVDIAALNHMNAADLIYVHQQLKLKGSVQNNQRTVQTKAIESHTEITRQTVDATTVSVSPAGVSTPAGTAILAKSMTLESDVSQVGLSAVTSNNKVEQVVNKSVEKSVAKNGWVLPSTGAMIDQFDLSKDKKGIFFDGKQGDPVFAAREGEVVYADDGLKEYGKLILLRHTEGYITAYAHNHRLIAKVGDRVQVGQKIAEMGSTGTDKVMLQFQIRLDGKPIDPETVLLN